MTSTHFIWIVRMFTITAIITTAMLVIGANIGEADPFIEAPLTSTSK